MIELDFIQTAILRTLIYSDIFDYPLTVGEIFLYLIGNQPCGQQEIVDALEDLRQQGTIGEKAGLFSLRDREDICNLRAKRQKWSEEKLIKAKKWVWLLRLIPWIRLVAVTGAVAAGNTDEGSDIDLMIIADAKRTWLTRFLFLGILKILGLRVDLKRGFTANRFCVNLFIADNCLEYPQKNLYTANEIVRIKPIFERNEFFQKFLKTNQWICSFLPNFMRSPLAGLGETSQKRLLASFGLLDFLEKITRSWQIKKIRQNFPQTNNLKDDELLLYQPHDCQEEVLNEYKKRCQRET